MLVIAKSVMPSPLRAAALCQVARQGQDAEDCARPVCPCNDRRWPTQARFWLEWGSSMPPEPGRTLFAVLPWDVSEKMGVRHFSRFPEVAHPHFVPHSGMEGSFKSPQASE